MRSASPTVSVVVTVKNDPRVIDCADRVLAQQTEFPFEFVIVDNGSRDETPRLLGERFRSDDRVTLLSSGGNLSEAWNRGGRAAKGDILVRIDADAIPTPGWLDAIVRPIVRGEADWTAGPVGGVNPAVGLVARYFHERTEAYGRRLAADPALRDAVPSWNVAYRRTVLDAAGWYDPWQASSVDWDLHKRLKRTGVRGQFVPGARCLHHHPQTLREFVRKEAWYHTGQYQMALKYGVFEVREAFVVPIAYALLAILAIAAFAVRPLASLAVGFAIALVLKHWIDGLRDRDPMWPYRALFRPLEGFAGLYGLLRGLFRYGARPRTRL